MAAEKGRKQRCKRCRGSEGTGDTGTYSKRILLSRVIWCVFMELGKGVCAWWRLLVQSQSSSLPARIPTVPLPLGCVSACSWLCTCMCSCVAGERDVLKKWVTERGVPRQDWCALVLCSLLLPAVSAAVSRQCTHTRLWAKHEWQPWEVARFSLLPSRMHLYLLEMRCYLLICLFLQKGTFQKLIHYQKFSIPLQFRHTQY